MKNYPEINWQEQCNFCTKGINTTYCFRNQNLIDLLKTMKNYRGDIDFECEFFALDNKMQNKK